MGALNEWLNNLTGAKRYAAWAGFGCLFGAFVAVLIFLIEGGPWYESLYFMLGGVCGGLIRARMAKPTTPTMR